jgi:hypothetical protein
MSKVEPAAPTYPTDSPAGEASTLRSDAMKYMLLIYGNEKAWESLPAEVFRETDALNRELLESGELVGAYGLGDEVETKMVRVNDGVPAVTDGPFTEAKEQLASFTVVDCESFQRALEIAARNPASRYVGVEVRPLTHEAELTM